MENEAIAHPETPFKGKGMVAIIKNDEGITTKIGVLGDPFGNVDTPFQPIILDKKSDLIGQNAFAVPRARKKKRQHKKRKNKSSSNKSN